jgi:hypothetical protein
MLSQWLQIEYYRLDCVESWEDGPRKQATRAAILDAIASLSGNGQGLPVYRSAHANSFSDRVVAKAAGAVPRNTLAENELASEI